MTAGDSGQLKEPAGVFRGPVGPPLVAVFEGVLHAPERQF